MCVCVLVFVCVCLCVCVCVICHSKCTHMQTPIYNNMCKHHHVCHSDPYAHTHSHLRRMHTHTASHKQLHIVLCVSQHVSKAVLFLFTPFLSFCTFIFNKEMFVFLCVSSHTKHMQTIANYVELQPGELAETFWCNAKHVHSTVDQNITAY